MTHKVGPKGQVVIPKEMRDRLGLVSGMKVEFKLTGDAVSVRPRRERKSLAGSFSEFDLTGDLLADRARERDR